MAMLSPGEVDRIPWTRERVLVTGGLMLAMFAAAMDATVVGTALPTIAKQLGQVELYPWIFAGYLLTSTTTVPLWGRLADLRGRKPVLLAGLAIFVGGSVLCAASPNMAALILFRALQGIGAGCLLPVTVTVVGDIFPIAQRARIQGLFSAMWAAAAAVGPLIGGVFVETIGWPWVFLVNLPIGLVCAVLFRRYRERREPPGNERLEYLGAVILTAGIAALLYGFGTGNPNGRPVWPVAAVGVVLLVFFGVRELRSRSPTIPVRLLADRLIGPGLLVATLAGTVMFGVSAYVPLYVQAGLGKSALEAGWAIGPLSIGWPVATVLVGRVLLRVGYRPIVALGALLMLVGMILLVLVAHLGALWIAGATFVIGFGLGSILNPILIVLQNAVAWQRRGSVTAMNQFARTIGGAIGVSLMGVLVESRLGGSLEGARVVAAIEPIFLVNTAVAAAVAVCATAILVSGPGKTSAPLSARSSG